MTTSVSIPDVSAAEGVIVHWLRSACETSPLGSYDDLACAAADAVFQELRQEGIQVDLQFGYGAALGVRVALEVMRAPLGGCEAAIRNAVADALEHVRAAHQRENKAA